MDHNNQKRRVTSLPSQYRYRKNRDTDTSWIFQKNELRIQRCFIQPKYYDLNTNNMLNHHINTQRGIPTKVSFEPKNAKCYKLRSIENGLSSYLTYKILFETLIIDYRNEWLGLHTTHLLCKCTTRSQIRDFD